MYIAVLYSAKLAVVHKYIHSFIHSFISGKTIASCTLLEKLGRLDIPDNVYNWLVSFFSKRTHCTDYSGVKSLPHDITASIIQGSAIGPVTYIINAADLSTVTPGNVVYKYADDTYLIIPAQNVDSRSAELSNVEA